MSCYLSHLFPGDLFYYRGFDDDPKYSYIRMLLSITAMNSIQLCVNCQTKKIMIINVKRTETTDKTFVVKLS